MIIIHILFCIGGEFFLSNNKLDGIWNVLSNMIFLIYCYAYIFHWILGRKYFTNEDDWFEIFYLWNLHVRISGDLFDLPTICPFKDDVDCYLHSVRACVDRFFKWEGSCVISKFCDGYDFYQLKVKCIQ